LDCVSYIRPFIALEQDFYFKFDDELLLIDIFTDMFF